MELNSGFFVMKLWQTGNIGSCNIEKVKSNPEKGYRDYEEAKLALRLMYNDSKNWEVKPNRYKYAIMELFW